MPGGKGGGTSKVTVINGPIDVDSDVTIQGLDDIGVTLQGGDKAIKTESRQEIVLPQPLKTRSEFEVTKPIVTDNSNDISVDVKPLAVDLCMTTTTNAGKLPEGVIRQPYHTHFGMTWFGIEFMGFTLSGESKTVYDNVDRKPSLEWPAQKSSPSKAHGGLRVRIK